MRDEREQAGGAAAQEEYEAQLLAAAYDPSLPLQAIDIAFDSLLVCFQGT